jgi:ribonuclease J
LCVAGRSLDRIIATAKASGYLKDLPETIDFDTAMALPRGQVLILATGGQGEPRAALARIATGSHKIKLESGDAVLFSSRQIPGNELAIGRIQNQLAGDGIILVTDRKGLIHVSGHPGRPELEALYSWIRPAMLVPVHGEMRHMQEQARLGRSSGIGKAIVQKNGDLLRLAPNGPQKLSEVRAGRLVLDGDIIAPADGEGMVMRRRLSHSGVVTVAVTDSGAVRVAALGLPLEEDFAAFIEEAQLDVAKALKAVRSGDPADRSEAARLAARRAATRWCGKKPQVIVTLFED